MTLAYPRLLIAAALALSVAACQEGGVTGAKHLRPVSTETRALMSERQMDLRAPILVRIFKAEGQLEVWKQQRNGRYAHLRSFEICRWSGDLGPKVREGDRQAPEGFYTVTPALMNPNSAYHLAFNTGYPNAFDRAHGRTGAHLMVHGDCSSRGCFAMTNAQMEEIFALARDAFEGGQRSAQLQIYPFRMTAENMFRYRRNPHIEFWRNLKEGSDHFEATGRPPEVRVCGRRYVFNQQPTNPDARFDPQAACPPAEVPNDIRQLVARRQTQDAQRFAELDREYRERRAPAASVMLARLTGSQQTAVAAATPAHHIYATRQQILAALPTSSPEALSMLPGAEAGPTAELRQIARGERIGGPPETASASIAATTAREGAPAPAPASAPTAGSTAVASNAPAATTPSAGLVDRLLNGGISAFASSEEAPVPPTASVPMPPPSPARTATRAPARPAPQQTAAAPAPETTGSTPSPARAVQGGMWQRFLGVIGVNAAPVSRN